MEQYTVEMVRSYILKRFGHPAEKLTCWIGGEIQVWINGDYFMIMSEEIKRQNALS
jgi:hypothetical protein